MFHRRSFTLFQLATLIGAAALLPSVARAQRAYDEKPEEWKFTIYPVYGWAPILGASVDIPSRPGGGNTTPRPEAKFDGSLNGAALAGFRIEKNRFSTYATGLWAGLSADRSNPNASLNLDVLYGQIMGGIEVLPGLSLEGGARRMALKITVNIEGYPSAYRKPGVWDPLVGLTYRKFVGRKWRVNLHADGGGFGVGSNVDTGLSGTAEWRFARHFGTVFGYQGIYFDIRTGIGNEEVRVKQTMHGPVFGFGIYF